MSAGDGQDRTPPEPEPSAESSESLLHRFLHTESGLLMFVREVLTSVAAVALVGLLLFAISGVWPPMVAVESGSMEPHMEKGDLIFVTEPGRFVPEAALNGTGVVPYRVARQTGYRSFGSYGSVVVYDNPDRGGPPIIHRARFWVEAGENWYDEADEAYVTADSCAELLNCPAPHAGFITKGDANDRYDQANGISPPVKPAWVTAVAQVRIPYLGWIRLGFSGMASVPAGHSGPGLVGAAGPGPAAAPTKPAAVTQSTDASSVGSATSMPPSTPGTTRGTVV